MNKTMNKTMNKNIEKWSNCIYINQNPGYNLHQDNIPMDIQRDIPSKISNDIFIVKIGSSKFLPARYYSYKTYSPVETQILRYYYIQNYDCYDLDDDLKRDLDKYRIHSTGGIEFYYSTILEHLEEYFNSRNIKYLRYNDISDFPPINNFNRISTIKQYQEEELIKASRKPKYNITIKSKPINKIILEHELIPHQLETLKQTIEHYKTQDKGILNLFCRYGKTRLSSLFVYTLSTRYKKIIILVPSLYLVNQTYKSF